MGKNSEPSFGIGIFIFIIICIIVIVVTSLEPSNSPASKSDIEELSRLQQERFVYEKKQEDIRQYLRTQEEINKIKSGYYN